MTGTTTFRQLSRLLTAALCVLGAATVLAQCARLGWLPELASHFRPQYLLALAILLPALLAIGRWKLALVAVALIAPNAWYALPYFLPLMAPASAAGLAESSVSLIALNLWYRNDRYADVRDYLERSAPDVMVLAELTPRWVTELGGSPRSIRTGCRSTGARPGVSACTRSIRWSTRAPRTSVSAAASMS